MRRRHIVLVLVLVIEGMKIEDEDEKCLSELLLPLQLVPVAALKSEAGVKLGLALVVLPDLVVPRPARLRAQGALTMDISLLVRVELQPFGLLERTQSVRQNNQDFSLHS